MSAPSIESHLIAVPFAFVLSWAIVRLRLLFADRGLDRPNHRSLHEKPTPHGGGLGIVLALLAAGAWLGVPTLLLSAVLGLALVSLADDLRPLPFWLRLAAHLGAAAACAGFLCFNWPPAKIFGIWQGAWPAWFPPMAFAPFVLDASTTLARLGMRTVTKR